MAAVWKWKHPVLLLLLLLVMTRLLAAEAGGANATAACPLDLGYVATLPWYGTACCMTLLSVLGVGLASRLRATGRFRLPSARTSVACLRAFSAALAAQPLSLPASLVPGCFPVQSQFAISPDYCAGVTTAAEYVAVAGNASVAGLNASCGADVTSMSLCNRCLAAGIDASARLTAAAGNGSKSQNCFYLTVLYAAGISSSAGPDSPVTTACALGLALSTPSPSTSSPTSSSDSHTNIAVAATIPIASLLLVSLVALLVWRNRQEHAKDRSIQISEERRSRPRPNTGSAGRPGDVLAQALRKEASTSVAAMERYVLVGILCAHVTVAFRPSMPEALRMLEGDMDVPDLPDRPQPFGQRIAFDEGETNFSASSILSGGGPLVDFGDMLR
ncbi:unnamed protein product [Miscanthus lutarioriparius]|uniref:SPARK domain-containing protein n=1 Tax=Miscanthus lutarioriparius TaxID=422564 RepID=A0A811P121_9POAL|nr:unnamed protein product [Miscanthus lutarioriparius]